jgi:hypothetical protein
MKYWVTGPCFRVDNEFLARMEQFVSSIQSSGTIKKLAQELHSATTERVWFLCFCQRLILSHHGCYVQLISLSRPHAKISQKPTEPTKPRDLAVALLAMERDKYTPILQADYISYFQQRSGENNVRAALETKEMITCWVQQAILRCDELGARSGLLKFFVSTAEVTYTLKFSTAHVTWTDRHFTGIS